MGYARVLLLLLATGCYQPAAQDCAYTCNAGTCPSGLYCVNKICRDEQNKQGSCTNNDGDGGPLDGVASNYPAAVLLDEPDSYFRLGETPADMLARNEIAMVGDGTYFRQVTRGAPGALTDASTAARFDPTDGPQCVRVTIGPYGIMPVDSFSLEAWIKIAAYPFDSTHPREIVGKLGSGTTDAGYSLGLQLDGQNKGRLRLRIGSGTQAMQRESSTLELDTWYHVVATLDGGNENVRFYVNGQDGIVASPFTNQVATNLGDFTIGCRDNNGTIEAGFDGTIDEVAFYRKVLPPGRIQAHYDAR